MFVLGMLNSLDFGNKGMEFSYSFNLLFFSPCFSPNFYLLLLEMVFDLLEVLKVLLAI